VRAEVELLHDHGDSSGVRMCCHIDCGKLATSRLELRVDLLAVFVVVCDDHRRSLEART
jgi:hypothetical protein